MHKKYLSIIIVVAVLILIFIFSYNPKPPSDSVGGGPTPNVEVKDGVQYITIKAKGGYLPRITTASANMPTKILVDTSGTYDCSASLVIRALNYQKILPQTGVTEIDAGTPKPGEELQGLCGMGMYNFNINFI